MTTIIIDTREQRPLEITHYQFEVATLPVGDYGIRGFSDFTNPRFIVERKSLSDLVGSLSQGRARFMREVVKMRAFEFKALLIEARRFDVESHAYSSDMTPASVLASLDAIQVRNAVQIEWAVDHRGASVRLESWVRQFIRGVEKQAKLLETAGAVA